jgi:hypothetical protein
VGSHRVWGSVSLHSTVSVVCSGRFQLDRASTSWWLSLSAQGSHNCPDGGSRSPPLAESCPRPYCGTCPLRKARCARPCSPGGPWGRPASWAGQGVPCRKDMMICAWCQRPRTFELGRPSFKLLFPTPGHMCTFVKTLLAVYTIRNVELKMFLLPTPSNVCTNVISG